MEHGARGNPGGVPCRVSTEGGRARHFDDLDTLGFGVLDLNDVTGLLKSQTKDVESWTKIGRRRRREDSETVTHPWDALPNNPSPTIPPIRRQRADHEMLSLQWPTRWELTLRATPD